MRVLLALLVMCASVGAQTISYFNQGFLRQGSAQADRVYLGLTNLTSVYGVLASSDFLNQGTLTTVLHGNAAGNPYWDTVDLATEVNGNLGVTHLNSGTGAGASTFWCGNGTWASIPTPNDIRTNTYNVFTGTNQFNTNVYVIGGLGVSGYSNMVDAYGPIPFAVKNQAANYNFFVSPVTIYTWDKVIGNNPIEDGIMLTSRATDRGSSAKTMVLSGGKLAISGDTISFFHQLQYVGGINGYGNLFWGANPTISIGYFGSTSGGIELTNFLHSQNYLWGEIGLLVSSNSWTRVPDYQVSGTSKSIADGENWYVSSNGWPHIISKRLGVVYTNDIPSVTRGIVTLPGLALNIVTVPCTAVSASSVVLLTYLSPDGDSGAVQCQNIINGTSFDILCSRANDAAGKVSWAVFNP